MQNLRVFGQSTRGTHLVILCCSNVLVSGTLVRV
uniref:Uncharacterized protein n=1 Tax=Anguilla anguilla TaxID=7936 RepID=A0A0E9T3X0_ANGAN